MAYLIHINLIDAATGKLKSTSMATGAHSVSLGSFPEGIRVELQELEPIEGQPSAIHLALNFQDGAAPEVSPQPPIFGLWQYTIDVRHKDGKGDVIDTCELSGAHFTSLSPARDPVTLELEQMGTENRFLAILTGRRSF